MSQPTESLNKPFLSLCMIVRNEAEHLERCLLSVKPFVDEMVVVDTGSEDETVAIAQRLGASVDFFEWIAGRLLVEFGFPLGVIAYFERCIQLGETQSFYHQEPFVRSLLDEQPQEAIRAAQTLLDRSKLM